MKSVLFTILTFFHFFFAPGQDMNTLLARLKAKLDKVNDYKASARLTTDIAFIKVPVANVNVYFKKPDRMRIKKEGGISIIPKTGLSVNMNSLLSMDHYAVVPAGETKMGNTTVKIVKLISLDDSTDIILTTLYIDEANLLILKSSTTTRDNGTFETEMNYGKWADWGLPDKVKFSFNIRNYKVPKGITFEYQDGEKPRTGEGLKSGKGKIEISYNSYSINKGLADSAFQ